MTRIHVCLFGFFALFLLSCTAQTAPESPDVVSRELIRIDAADIAQSSHSISQTPSPAHVPTDEACESLVDGDDIFPDDAGQNAWKRYTSNNFAQAADDFERLAAQTTYTAVQRQKFLFISSLAVQKMDAGKNAPDHDARAIRLLSAAFALPGPLEHIIAVMGTKLSYRAKRWAEVIDFTETLLNSEQFRTYRGIALTNLGRYEAAVSEFDHIDTYPKALRLDALEARARAQSETSQSKAALETYRRIYELNPSSPQGQMAQDAIMAQKDKWPKGFVFPRPTTKPDRSKDEREIAKDHFEAHRSEKAIAAYSKLLKTNKARKDLARVCDDLYQIARSYVKLRAHDKSLPYFKEALSACNASDMHVKVLYSGAKAAWNANENQRALSWYQSIIDDYPQHSYADDAYHYQALILSSQSDADAAREKLQLQIQNYPDGDMAKDAYWMLLSDLYDRKQYEDAVSFVEKNNAHSGESDLYSQGRLRYFQARAYEHLGNGQAALQNYLTILDAYPLSYYAMLSLGRLQHLDESQAKIWLDTYRPQTFEPLDAQHYCFRAIAHDNRFQSAKLLTYAGLNSDALDEIDELMTSPNTDIVYEAKLARAILLQRAGRHSDSARLAAGLLNPVRDLMQKNYAAWLLAYPKPWESLVDKAAKNDRDLYYTTYAIMREESYYNPKAESWANARGLMQLMLPTAQSTAAEIGMSKPSANDLFKPEIGIPIGSAYIAKLYRILIPHPMFVLPGYNAGQGNVGKWIKRFADLDVDVYVEKIPFKEARHYAKRVGTTLWRYRWLYDSQMPPLFDPNDTVGSLNTKKD